MIFVKKALLRIAEVLLLICLVEHTFIYLERGVASNIGVQELLRRLCLSRNYYYTEMNDRQGPNRALL